MSPYFSYRQLFILHALILGAALLQRLHTRSIRKIHSKFLIDQKDTQQNDSHTIVEYLNELFELQAAYSLTYFYLVFIAILLVNIFIYY